MRCVSFAGVIVGIAAQIASFTVTFASSARAFEMSEKSAAGGSGSRGPIVRFRGVVARFFAASVMAFGTIALTRQAFAARPHPIATHRRSGHPAFLWIRSGMKSFLLSACLISVSAVSFAAPENLKTLEPGAKAPDFDLPGVDGKNHTLEEYAEADILAILFTCNHCPSAQGAESRVKSIVADYADKSFQLVAISPNSAEAVRLNELGYSVYGDSLEDMKLHAKAEGFTFPYLYDGETQSVSEAYGVMATPHIYIFDKARTLQYVGRIDDSKYGDPATITKHDAREAIDAMLAGKPVANPKTRAHGCSTKWKSKIGANEKYNADFEAKPVTIEKIDVAGVKDLAKNDTDKLRLINLWATWCGPCVAEMPALVEIGRQFETRGFDMITISQDSPDQLEAAGKMLSRFHAAMPKLTEASVKEEGRTTNNYLFEGDSDAFAEALDKEWPGPIPHTILIAPGGEIIYRKTGEIDPDELKRKIVDTLGRWYSPK